jgi:hypothetical protein
MRSDPAAVHEWSAQPAGFSFVLLNAPGRTRLATIEIVVGAASHCGGPSPDGPAR